MTELKETLYGFRKDLNILQEREAKYAGNVPLELIHQIEDYQTAIGLTEATLEGQLSQAEWREALRPLLLVIDQRATASEVCQVTIGDIGGDVRDSIIAGRDVTQNTQNIQIIYQNIYVKGEEPTKKKEIPPQPFEPKTVLIPAGPFVMGLDEEGDWVRHEVTLPAYRIGQYPVTNEEYAAFVKEHPDRRPGGAGWRYINPPAQQGNYPVVGISWEDALAYCQWLRQETGRGYRLPTEAEWEKAARGDKDGRIYPWGDELTSDHCNYASDRTTPVNQYEAGQSPYKCYDMVGNVREWTSTRWGEDWRRPQFIYPYDRDDGRENLNFSAIVFRIQRGGAYNDNIAQLGCAPRNYDAANASDKNVGFRVALDIQRD